MATIPGTVLDFIKTEYESNKTGVLALIQKEEGGAAAFITAEIKNSPKPAGALGILYGYLEPQLETYVSNLITTGGPTVIYTFIDGIIAQAAKAAGG